MVPHFRTSSVHAYNMQNLIYTKKKKSGQGYSIYRFSLHTQICSAEPSEFPSKFPVYVIPAVFGQTILQYIKASLVHAYGRQLQPVSSHKI